MYGTPDPDKSVPVPVKLPPPPVDNRVPPQLKPVNLGQGFIGTNIEVVPNPGEAKEPSFPMFRRMAQGK